jgi:hypothetical protein
MPCRRLKERKRGCAPGTGLARTRGTALLISTATGEAKPRLTSGGTAASVHSEQRRDATQGETPRKGETREEARLCQKAHYKQRRDSERRQ